MKQEIPFFNYPALFAAREGEYLDIIQDVLRRGHYIMGPDLIEFEERLANYVGTRHAVGMADGTMSILAGLVAAGVGPGDEVLVPSHTFVATAAAVHHAGGTPVMVDCGADHLIDPVSAEAAITDKTKVILPVQLNGRTANMARICQIADKHGLEIVEDSCQALGSKFRGQCAGTFGVAGSFSFFPSKTLGCFGDGGALVTNDDKVAERVRIFRDHGRGSDGKVHLFGFNARLDNIHAAVLLYKLSWYEEAIEKRRKLATIYNDRLRNCTQLLLPPAPDSHGDHYDVYQNYEVEAENRQALRTHLADHGVGTILQWGGYTIHQFEKLGLNTDVPYTERMSQKFMLLPMNTAVTVDEVHRVCDLIEGFYQ
ncbi:MAG: DegT/DnrJ/EryC1/StrS family aminotransferase [Sphingomonadales bacterium]